MANKVGGFFSDVRQELGKVVWPTREELLGSTSVVIVTTFLLAAFIGIVDFILSTILRLVMS